MELILVTFEVLSDEIFRLVRLVIRSKRFDISVTFLVSRGVRSREAILVIPWNIPEISVAALVSRPVKFIAVRFDSANILLKIGYSTSIEFGKVNCCGIRIDEFSTIEHIAKIFSTL